MSSHLSGTAAEVVQARDISGGIHFHPPFEQQVPIPQQLPGNVRGFVNRVGELAHLDAVLAADSGVSVAVVAGTAGVGKTALILHWSHQNRHRFPGGQLYINLRGYDPGDPVTPMTALERFLAALGVVPGAVPTELEARADMYRSLLAGRQMLVVLDNAATVGQVRPLLPGAENCLVLVTSRNRFSGLIARDGAQRVTVPLLSEFEAVRLLQTTTAGYRDADQDNQVAELARLCGRLPLALRIAAERAAARPHVPLTSLIRDLRDESLLWDALSSEDEEEADGVRTVFAWSYRALPTAPARLFRLLGVHPGPEFSTAAAAALAALPESETRRLLDVLVGTYLLEQSGHDRYQFHDLLRAYAADQAAEYDDPSDRHTALERVCTWYLHSLFTATGVADLGSFLELVPAGYPPMPVPDFPDSQTAAAWIEVEVDTLIACAHAAADAGLDGIAWQTLALLRFPYSMRHPVDACISLGEQALSAAERAGDPAGQITALVGLGISYRLAQRLDEAVDRHRRAVLIDIDDLSIDMFRRNALALALMRARQFGEACSLFDQVHAIADHAQNPRWATIALGNLALAYFEAGNLEEADAAINNAFDTMPQEFSTDTHADFLNYQAMIHRERGHFAEAHEAIAGALAMNQGADLLLEGAFEYERARILLATNEPGQALESLAHALAIHRRVGSRSREALAFVIIGQAYQALARASEAEKFYRQAAAIHQDLHDDWNRAVSLAHLADVLARRGADGDSHDACAEALDLLHAFNDPRTVQLRHELTARPPSTST
ncbi:ATP-binding protein [Nocardia noduli]|uniref:ATP-binding protein n=1 Tax=Nocardia noduli TaxID=2815722 RepID=UPI001C230518|nr:tetratricopeptide repeat protein [Nocardia noduli]